MANRFICMWILVISHKLDYAVSANVELPSKDECGRTKGCVFVPSNCDPNSNCIIGVTYKKNGDYIDFELLNRIPSNTTSGRYAAIGFSKDTKMGDDAVTYCYYSPNTVKVSASMAYNPGKYNEPISDRSWINTQLKDITGAVINGYLVCRFSQKITPPSANGANKQIFLLSTNYYLLLASGSVQIGDNGTASLLPHVMDANSDYYPTITGTQVELTSQQGATEDTSSVWRYKLVKSHGILMIFAWWLLLACGILFARYFKTMLNHKKIFNLDLWFHLHRGLNIIAVLAIATAFVCIFVARDGYWTGVGQAQWYPRVTHAILGMTASIGSFIQPIMALFRCHKGETKRPIFDWLHRFVGLASWGCASAAIWMSTEFMNGMQTTTRYGIAPRALMYFYWASLGFVVIGLEIWITVSERMRSRRTPVEDIHMRSINGKVEAVQSNSSNKYGIIRWILMLFFILVAISVTIALACFIALP